MIIRYPQEKEKLALLKAGDIVEFEGVIYTARDAAHKRIQEYLEQGKELPVDFKDSFIYYAGPTPTKPGKVIGSIGPTTSSRMDPYADMMNTLGVVATIGKGPRSIECTQKYIDHHLLYFVTTGGCGALLSKAVQEAEEIAFLDLGPESIKRLYVKNFKMIVAIDYKGNNLFKGR
jgi:fumarate hydratase subunit beta